MAVKESREKEVLHLEKILKLLKEHRVKEYKSAEIHIQLDTTIYTDPTKLYEKMLQAEQRDVYGYEKQRQSI